MASIKFIDYVGTHRLIPTKYSKTGSVLETLPVSSAALSGLSELDAATNDRKQMEIRGDEQIGPRELLYGVPNAHIVNAAFCHANPNGSRFNTSDRGAWYAGVEVEAAVAEVVFHKRRFQENGGIEGQIAAEYADYLADIYGEFHHLSKNDERQYLKPDPVPQCYRASQSFATKLLYQGANGIVYRSVRAKSGTCIACFRPALVTHVHRGNGYRITVEAGQSAFKAERFTLG